MLPDDFEFETRWEDAHEALRDFQAFLACHVPVLRIERNADVLDWENRQGVYLNYDGQDRLLYVGLTLVSFQNRKRHHEQRFETRWLDLIVFREELLFLAPALEYFLRKRLCPMLDSGGKHV